MSLRAAVWSRTPRSRALVAALLTGVLAVLSSALLTTATTTTAVAHSVLVGSSPSDGDGLDSVPEAVRLEFNERVTPDLATVTLTLDGETRTLDVRAGDSNRELVADLPADGPEGRWNVGYRVTSTDGHPITGEVRFWVADPENADNEATDDQASHDQASTSTGDPVPVWVVVAVLGGVALVVVGVVVAARRRGPTR